jgi:hypothetical protein
MTGYPSAFASLSSRGRGSRCAAADHLDVTSLRRHLRADGRSISMQVWHFGSYSEMLSCRPDFSLGGDTLIVAKTMRQRVQELRAEGKKGRAISRGCCDRTDAFAVTLRDPTLHDVHRRGSLRETGADGPPLRGFASMSPRFMSRSSTVTRPAAVRPSTRSPSTTAKWSVHSSERGLKSAARCPVAGSIPCVRAPLRSEHETHARARLSSVVVPPRARGTTWSMWKVASWPAWASRQYSQRS